MTDKPKLELETSTFILFYFLNFLLAGAKSTDFFYILFTWHQHIRVLTFSLDFETN